MNRNRRQAGQFMHGRAYAWGVTDGYIGSRLREFLAMLDTVEPGWADQVEECSTRQELWQDFLDFVTSRGPDAEAPSRKQPARFSLAG